MALITGTDPRHAAFREWVWEAFQRGQFNIAEAVEREIQRSPALSAEMKRRGVAADSDPAIASEAADMLARLEAEGRIASEKCVDVNDLQIILTAKRYGLTVVTDEAQCKERYNIPTVCRKLGVRCISSAELLAKHGF